MEDDNSVRPCGSLIGQRQDHRCPAAFGQTTPLFRARWCEQILDEMVRSILERRADLHEERLARTRRLMCDAVAD